MKRLALAALIAAAAMFDVVASADAQTIELKVSHFLPPNHTFQRAMTAWAERLATIRTVASSCRSIRPASSAADPTASSMPPATASSTSRSACMARRPAATR